MAFGEIEDDITTYQFPQSQHATSFDPQAESCQGQSFGWGRSALLPAPALPHRSRSMTPERDDAEDLSPARAFDRFLMVLAVLGAAVAVLAAIVAFRGESAGATGVEGEPAEQQTHGIRLSEFAIEGPGEIPAGPTVRQASNNGSTAHNLAEHPTPPVGG